MPGVAAALLLKHGETNLFEAFRAVEGAPQASLSSSDKASPGVALRTILRGLERGRLAESIRRPSATSVAGEAEPPEPSPVVPKDNFDALIVVFLRCNQDDVHNGDRSSIMRECRIFLRGVAFRSSVEGL